MTKCYECHKEVDEESYCFGCKESICEECESDIPWTLASQTGHGHTPGDHFIPADGYDKYGEEIDGEW